METKIARYEKECPSYFIKKSQPDCTLTKRKQRDRSKIYLKINMYIFLQFTSLNCRILLYFCLFVLLLSLWLLLLLLLLFCDDQLRISTDLRPEAQIQGFDTVSDCTVCVLPQITALDLQSNVLFGLLLLLFDHLLDCFATWQSNCL